MIDFEKIKTLFGTSKKVVLTSHRGPDGDALGSTLGLSKVLKALGHSVEIVLPDAFPDFISWMPGADDVVLFSAEKEKAIALIDSADVLFALDYNSSGRIADVEPYFTASKAFKIMIDHHINPTDFCDQYISKPEISSTSQLVYEFMEKMGWEDHLTIDGMECLYAGIVTDTGSFRFSSVDVGTHRVASIFMEKGMDNAKVHQLLFDNNEASRLRLLGYCLNEKLEIFPDNQSAFISLTQEELDRFKCSKGDTDGFVNYALSLKGINLAVYFVEQDGIVKLSTRSIGNLAVNRICSDLFNGGGHMNAAGGIFEGTLETAKDYFKQNVFLKLEHYFNK